MNEPWGHRRDTEGHWQPNRRDISPAMGPAGNVHLTLEDWATFAGLWLGETPEVLGLGRDALHELTVPAVSLPSGAGYAAGWIVTERNWGGGTVLTHGGTNLNWYSVMWMAPNTGRAFVATANSADDDTLRMLDVIVGGLIGECTGQMSCGPSYWSYGDGEDLRGWLSAGD